MSQEWREANLEMERSAGHADKFLKPVVRGVHEHESRTYAVLHRQIADTLGMEGSHGNAILAVGEGGGVVPFLVAKPMLARVP